jgi:hypothetical protein
MTLSERILEQLGNENPEALTADGFDEALIGICNRYGQPAIAAYDEDKCIEILMTRDGMSQEEAREFFEFNVIGAFVGENTPCFTKLFTKITN